MLMVKQTSWIALVSFILIAASSERGKEGTVPQLEVSSVWRADGDSSLWLRFVHTWGPIAVRGTDSVLARFAVQKAVRTKLGGSDYELVSDTILVPADATELEIPALIDLKPSDKEQSFTETSSDDKRARWRAFVWQMTRVQVLDPGAADTSFEFRAYVPVDSSLARRIYHRARIPAAKFRAKRIVVHLLTVTGYRGPGPRTFRIEGFGQGRPIENK